MVSTRSDEISSKGSNLETEKGRAIFVLYATLPLNLIIIAIMIHQDISYSNLHMVGTRICLVKKGSMIIFACNILSSLS